MTSASAHAAAERMSILSSREHQVIGRLAQGLSNSGIAKVLYLSERTVDAHVRSIFLKLGLAQASTHNRRVIAALAWTMSHTLRGDDEFARTA